MNSLSRQMDRVAHLNRIALALARDVTPEEMAHAVTEECSAVLEADAICLYLLLPDDFYQLASERGCTPEFITRWNRVPRQQFRLRNAESGDELFFGTAGQFKQKFPASAPLVESSGRAMIGYAPLNVDNHPIGLLGFSYNQIRDGPLDRPFVSLLVNLCSLALERANLSQREKAANRAKSEFLANVNHELRTPLSLIQGYTELLVRDGDLSEKSRHWAKIVHRGTRQLASLVGEVLDLSKIESAKLEVIPSAVQLKELVEEVRLAARQKAEERGLHFEILDEGLPDYLWIDSLRLRQILLNLISNSIKFTECGYVRVRLYMRSEDWLEAIVTDTGVGIPTQDHQTVFEPFVQVSGEGHRKLGGTGLGLPISRAWARALGGDLNLLRSEPGNGSEFLLSLRCRPCTTAETEEVKRREPKSFPQRQRTGELAGLTALVVDDSADNRDLIRLLLQRQGVAVETAANGFEGVRRARAKKYDVILMDLQMPGLDGLSAVKQLREQGYSGAIAALTAHAMKEQKERAMSDGFDSFVTKPIDLTALTRAIQELLGLRAGNQNQPGSISAQTPK